MVIPCYLIKLLRSPLVFSLPPSISLLSSLDLPTSPPLAKDYLLAMKQQTLLYLLFAWEVVIAQVVNASQAINTFINELNLPAASAKGIHNKLFRNVRVIEPILSGQSVASLEVVQLACDIAQIALGFSAVNTTPVNQTETDGTWSEVCWETPTCAILPNSDRQVSLAMKIINFFQTKFAVRSGGHSPNPGWSSVGQPGILIDLQLLHEIVVSPDASVVSLGPGNRWGDVYSALDPYQVSVIGGRINDVGVGGLILGGIIALFSKLASFKTAAIVSELLPTSPRWVFSFIR